MVAAWTNNRDDDDDDDSHFATVYRFARDRDLEKQRTITSMPLAEERQILRDISYAKKQKLRIDEYNAIDKQLQEKRVRMCIAWSSLLFLAV